MKFVQPTLDSLPVVVSLNLAVFFLVGLIPWLPSKCMGSCMDSKGCRVSAVVMSTGSIGGIYVWLFGIGS